MFAFIVLVVVRIICGAREVSGEDGSWAAPPLVINTWDIPKAAQGAWTALTVDGMDAVDSIVAGCSLCEDGSCGGSIGLGGSADENGETTLDAMIMDGRTMDMGSVGCLRECQDAIGTARAVMKYTTHSMLVGDLATEFAVSMGFERKSLQTNQSYDSWQNWLNNDCQPNFRQNVIPDPDTSCGPYSPNVTAYEIYNKHLQETQRSLRFNPNVDETHHDTIGMVAVDGSGNVAAGTTTNGASRKVPGRVGDSPIVGAGAYAKNGAGGAAATGDGDVMMTFLPSFHTVQLMDQGHDPTTAARMAIDDIVAFYPGAYAGVVAANVFGEHGGACHNFGPFKYNMVNSTTGSVDTFTIPCS